MSNADVLDRDTRGAVVPFSPPRLPYHEAIKERFDVDKAGWNALIGAIYPNAKTTDAVCMALSYCRARKLDPFKRPVHIVPMWSSAQSAMVETVWPGISELRTTAFRTGQFAGMSEPEFGPIIDQEFAGKATKGAMRGQERTVKMKAPEWCRITITRELNGKERKFVGPKVYWLEAYAKWADTDVPNDMWQKRPIGQLEKCAEAAALRRAFPEEIGNDLTAEEMEGQRIIEHSTAPSIQPDETPPAPPPAIEHKPSVPMEAVAVRDVVELVEAGQSDPTTVEWTEPEGEEPPAPPPVTGAVVEDPEPSEPVAVTPAVEDVFPGDLPPPKSTDHPLDIPEKFRRTKASAPKAAEVVDVEAWLTELANRLSGCETVAELTEIQGQAQKPMQGRVSKQEYARSQTLVMEAFHRISSADDEPGDGEGEV